MNNSAESPSAPEVLQKLAGDNTLGNRFSNDLHPGLDAGNIGDPAPMTLPLPFIHLTV